MLIFFSRFFFIKKPKKTNNPLQTKTIAAQCWQVCRFSQQLITCCSAPWHPVKETQQNWGHQCSLPAESQGLNFNIFHSRAWELSMAACQHHTFQNYQQDWLSDLKFNAGTEGYPSVNHTCMSVWIFPWTTFMCAIVNWIRERILETFFLHHCPPIPEVSCFLPSETDITSCELL